jgi:hypothetical protein
MSHKKKNNMVVLGKERIARKTAQPTYKNKADSNKKKKVR